MTNDVNVDDQRDRKGDTMHIMRHLFVVIFTFVALGVSVWAADPPAVGDERAGGAHRQARPSWDDGLTPEQKMNRRFPQPVRVGDLLGLPILDYDDRTLGQVTQVVRSAAGKNVLVVRTGSWFGRDSRMVPVPIETVAILGRQIALLDITRKDFLESSPWSGAGDSPIDPNQSIRIAITRR